MATSFEALTNQVISTQAAGIAYSRNQVTGNTPPAGACTMGYFKSNMDMNFFEAAGNLNSPSSLKFESCVKSELEANTCLANNEPTIKEAELFIKSSLLEVFGNFISTDA
jgi:hypothetical protein